MRAALGPSAGRLLQLARFLPITMLPCAATTLPPLAGVLFDASQFLPPLAPTVNLAEPGPRACTRLWAALLESLLFIDATVSVFLGLVLCMLWRCACWGPHSCRSHPHPPRHRPPA